MALVDQVKAVIILIEPMVLLDITYDWSLVMTCGFYAKSAIYNLSSSSLFFTTSHRSILFL